MLFGIDYAVYYFVMQALITYHMAQAQAEAAKRAADSQTEMAEKNAELQNDMQEEAQEQNLDKAKQLNLAEDMEKDKLNQQKLQQQVAFKEAYGTNIAQLGDFSMSGNTVGRIFGTIDRRLSENTLNIDRDIEALGSNFGFARNNLQTQTDMGVLGSNININSFKTGEHMGVDPNSAWLGVGASWMSSGADSYRLSHYTPDNKK